MRIELTSDWTPERIASYGPEITAALRKLADRFPETFTVRSLADDLFSGRSQLWLILDGDKFMSIVVTEIKTTQDFIDRVASKSSTSGQAYLIRFKNGRTVECRKFLTQLLTAP